MEETDFQGKIAARVIREGGFCKKWPSGVYIGMPDLLVQCDVGTFYLEAKFLQSPVTNFNRKVNIREAQNIIMGKLLKAGGAVGVLTIVYYPRKGAWLHLVKPPKEIPGVGYEEVIVKGVYEPVGRNIDYNAYDNSYTFPWDNKSLRLVDFFSHLETL